MALYKLSSSSSCVAYKGAISSSLWDSIHIYASCSSSFHPNFWWTGNALSIQYSVALSNLRVLRRLSVAAGAGYRLSSAELNIDGQFGPSQTVNEILSFKIVILLFGVAWRRMLCDYWTRNIGLRMICYMYRWSTETIHPLSLERLLRYYTSSSSSSFIFKTRDMSQSIQIKAGTTRQETALYGCPGNTH